MPFGSADDPFTAYRNAELLIDKGADCVKVEGWSEKKNVISCLAERESMYVHISVTILRSMAVKRKHLAGTKLRPLNW